MTATNGKQNVNNKPADQVFSYLVERIRNEVGKGTSQTQIARNIGVSQALISLWLSGKRGGSTSLTTIMRCYRALGGDMGELLRSVLGEEVASPIVAAYEDDPEILEAIAILLTNPESSATQRWRDLTLYLSQQSSE